MSDLSKRLLSVSTVLARGMLANPEIMNPHMGPVMTNQQIVDRAVDMAELLIGEVGKRVKNVK